MIFFLSFIHSLCTTIRPKNRVLINLLFLFVHDHSTKLGVTLTLLFILFLDVAILPLLYSWQILPLHLIGYFFCARPFDQKIRSTLIYFFIFDQKLGSSIIYLFYLYTTIRRKIRVLIDLFFYWHTTIRPNYTVLFHLFFLQCATIRPKIRVHIDFFFFFTRPFDQIIGSSFIYYFFSAQPFDQKLESSLMYIFHLHTTIRQTYMIFFISFILVHDHSTKN